MVDFTDLNNEITHGTNAQTSFGMPTGVVAMWAGNVSGGTTIRYQGSGNDTNTIKDNVLIGMGRIVMDKCVVESNSIMGAGAVVGNALDLNSFIHALFENDRVFIIITYFSVISNWRAHWYIYNNHN